MLDNRRRSTRGREAQVAQATLPPSVLARARVVRVTRLGATFARITFTGQELNDFGTPGHTFDQRIKVIFPGTGQPLPELAPDDWYQRWLALPETERGAMRTYSIRDIHTGPNGTEVVVDFVLHLVPGATGPASRWASAAAPGDEVLLVGPRRGRFEGGGIEYAPGEAARVLLAGDETAAPAIARILEDAPSGLTGDAFIELPGSGEPLDIAAPPGVTVHWLGRADASPGSRLEPAVLAHVGGDAPEPTEVDGDTETGRAELMWETPTFSALGEALDVAGEEPDLADSCYFWIAGESRVVTRLRRALVREHGVHRSAVAFMGYWREGVAMM